MATKQRKGIKSAKRKTTRAVEPQVAETPRAAPKLIAELAAMKLAPKRVAKLEALTESQQETVLAYVNQGQRVAAAYKRVVGAKADATPETTVEAPPAPPAKATPAPTPEATKPASMTPARRDDGSSVSLPGHVPPRLRKHAASQAVSQLISSPLLTGMGDARAPLHLPFP